jgi:hypothetical protein
VDVHIDNLNIHYPDAIDLSTYIRTSGAWVAFDPNTKLDTSAYQPPYPMSAIDHKLIQNIGTYAHSAVDNHIDDLKIHFPDTVDLSTYLRTSGAWVAFDPNTKVDTSGINQYTTTANFNSHTSDTSIHYVVSAIDHKLIQNVGIYAHSAVDVHISATNNPHQVTKTQVGLSAVDNTSDLNKPISTLTQTALNLKFDTSGINQYTTTASFNNHTSNVSIHFADVVDGSTYLRTSGSWVQYTPNRGGPTSARPNTPPAYTSYVDTDLGYRIDFIPPNWVNATGSVV